MFSGVTCLLGKSDYLVLLCLNSLLLLSPSHLGQMGFNPMQTFGVGAFFFLLFFFLSLVLFFFFTIRPEAFGLQPSVNKEK